MKYTAAEASKKLKKLNEQRKEMIEKEARTSIFCASVGEDPESVRPKYDFQASKTELEEIERQIRELKHAINRFNIETEVRDFGMTIDQMLVWIPQLSERKEKLKGMANRLPKQRQASEYRRFAQNNFIDYEYANYDIEEAEEEYEKITDLLSKAQMALDVANTTGIIEM